MCPLKLRGVQGLERTFDPGCVGHTMCSVCTASSKQVKWAATHTNDFGITIPRGRLCHECVLVFEAKESEDIPDLRAFVTRAFASKTFRMEVAKCKSVMKDGTSPDFNLPSHEEEAERQRLKDAVAGASDDPEGKWLRRLQKAQT